MLSPADCLKKYGLSYDNASTKTVNENTNFEYKWMILWDVPKDINDAIPTIPNKIYCNRDMVAPLEKVFRNIMKAALCDQIKTWDGCFNLRPMRGYEKIFLQLLADNKIEAAVEYMSIHCWGVAIDINASWNQLNMIPTISPELVKCFLLEGFDWGGAFRRKDGMHFQLSKI